MAEDLLQRKKELLRQRLAADGLVRADGNSDAVAPARPEGATSPLAPAQRRLWFVSHRDPSDTSLNVGVAYRLDGPLDAGRLRDAFDAVVARHESLRSTYELGPDGDPVARHHAPRSVPWQEVDLAESTGRARDRRLQVLSRREFGTPFDLTSQFPIRLLLARLAADQHIVMLTVHHICWDDESWSVLFDEVNAVYNAGDSSSRPALTRQYADLPHTDPEVVANDLRHWREHLNPVPEPLALPADAPPAGAERSSGRVIRALSPELSRRVDEFARESSVSPFTVHAAITDALIHRITGAVDFTVAVPVTHRPADAADLIGYFGNTLLNRTRLVPTDSLAVLTAAARDRLIAGFAHQNAPVDAVVGAINPDRGTGGDGLAQLVSVSLSARRQPGGPALDGITARHVDELTTPNAQLPLEFGIVSGDRTHLELEYDASLFADVLAEGIADAYVHLLGQALATPTRPVRDLELLDPAAYARVLEASTGLRAPVADTTVVDLFAAAVRARADHEAVVSDDVALTYRQLDERSNRLAHWMLRSGVGTEDLVGLRMGGSVGFVVASLAVLKAGAAYLPIDPDYPDDRTEFLLDDAAPRLVLDADALVAAEAEAADCPDAAPDDRDRRSPLRPDNLAYVIYTSGSTGTPKGVPVAHKAIADHLTGFGAGEVLSPDDRLVQTSSVSFDASMFEVFCTLVVGATLVIPKPRAVQDISYMADLLVRQRVTVMHMVPTLLSTLLMVPEVKQWTMLRTVPVGGEAFSGEVADSFTTTFDAALSNNYGPTEAVVAATHFPVDGPQGSSIVPIGTPNTNVTSYLLDAGLHLVPDGVVGEIYLGGSQLARGYLGRAALTSSRFVADPFGRGGRLYRTGDLARRNSNGDLEFEGRADEQVKVRGYRIELGEVEAALVDHPDVAHAVALVDDAGSGARLIGYVIPAPHAGDAIDLADVLRNARTVVPEYLVPAALAVIDEIPLTAHGKLDRGALPDIGAVAQSDREPATPTERRVAAVYAELFGRDDISAGSSFFDLGGHSLLAARLVTTLITEFGIDVDVRLPLDNPTVEGLAAAVNTAVRDEFGIDLDELGALDDLDDTDPAPMDAGRPSVATGRPPLQHVDRPDPVPLSFSQLAMWFQHRFEGPGAAGNIPLALRIDGPLDVTALARAVDDVVGRHESLRTTFVERDGLPTARVAERVQLELPVVDVGDADECASMLADAREHLFDLAVGPLLKPMLLREDETRHVLSLVIHHMVIDHWSTDVLISDLVEAYRARVAGTRPDRAAPALTYTDYALWQHRVFPVGVDSDRQFDDPAAQFGRRQIDHWQTALAGQPDEITVTPDRTRPQALTKAGVLADLAVTPESRQRLRRLADDAGATEFMTVTAALTGLLSRLGGGDDIAVGTPVAGRLDPGTDDLVGLYANMVVLRTRIDGSLTVGELIGRSRDAVLGAFANQDVPIERLVEAINPRRTRSRNPLFQSMIHFRDRDQNAWGRPMDAAGETTLTLLPVEQDTSFLDLNTILTVTEDGGLEGRVVGSADLYDQETIDGIAAAFAAMLESFGAGPDTALGAITLPAIPGVLTADRHGDDPSALARLIVDERPRRVHASPRTLAALQHTGSTDLGSVREWVVTEAGAGSSLAESLAALSPGSRLTDPYGEVAPAVVAMAQTAGGGAQTPTEERLIAILSDLLGVDGLGRDDNFFAVGGDSVISIQWSARAAAEGLPLAPQQIFDHYSIAELAAAVDAAEAEGVGDGVVDEPEAAPMSASGLSDDMLQSLGAAWKSQQ
ncbi:amino acid adenylation domain-containing protein [Gordonia sp. SID5947]|uniref:non-ribosomal peptide synthetase n=1 Tax=Gordonia sp. SID5947 TaxID=2690315 RepID=UPI0013691B7A|nr:non-ribosomal peptide synthetase [Gordonia sp. SID5947]MYR07112.1 amino acid adenylation domain-containing protein [Gordonia sp. SID5947]